MVYDFPPMVRPGGIRILKWRAAALVPESVTSANALVRDGNAMSVKSPGGSILIGMFRRLRVAKVAFNSGLCLSWLRLDEGKRSQSRMMIWVEVTNMSCVNTHM